MTPHANCLICGADIENLDHVFRKCPHALLVWHALRQNGLRPVRPHLGLQEWFKCNATGVHEDPDWPTKFLSTTWSLWKWRCKAYFDNSEQESLNRGRFLDTKFNKTIQAFGTAAPSASGSPLAQGLVELVRWELPPGGWASLNTDGAAKGNPGPAGAGGVIRGDRG